MQNNFLMPNSMIFNDEKKRKQMVLLEHTIAFQPFFCSCWQLLFFLNKRALLQYQRGIMMDQAEKKITQNTVLGGTGHC